MDENHKHKDVLYILCKYFIFSDSPCEHDEEGRREEVTAADQLLCHS